MKKINKITKIIFFFAFLFNFQNLLATNTWFSKNKTYSGQVKFKGLKYRQQIIHISKKLFIINVSKSTSFSSTIPQLENNQNIYWILGGLAKKGDKFTLKKKYFSNIKAYVYGKDKDYFTNLFKNKFFCKKSSTLKNLMKNLIKNINKDDTKKVILFSPSAASFDQFKNFEDRGKFFNNLVKILLKKLKYE